MFRNRVVVVTGGAKGIGKTIAEEFSRAGAHVCIIDLLPNQYFVGDVGKPFGYSVLSSGCRRSYGKKSEI